jgi:hypothetical protein
MKQPKFKQRPTHQGLLLTDMTVEEVEAPKLAVPDCARAEAIAWELVKWIHQVLPLMFHAPIRRIFLEIPQTVKSFEHLPLIIRGDVLQIPEHQRKPFLVLVRHGWIDLTKQQEEYHK